MNIATVCFDAHDQRVYQDSIDRSDRNAAAAFAWAEDEVMADSERFASWLDDACNYSTRDHCRIGYVPRDPVHFANFVESLDVPQLSSLSRYPDRDIAGAASMELTARYMRDPATVAYINKLADEKGEEL